MFAVDENIGGQVTNTVSAPGEWGKLILLLFGLLVGLMLIFVIIAYFARKKLPKEERKAKFIKLP